MSIAGEKVLPTVNEVKGWTKTEQLITFLDNQKQNFGLEDEHLVFFRKKGVNGISFLRLNADKLTNAGLELGPAETIAELIENIKCEGQGQKKEADVILTVDAKILQYSRRFKKEHSEASDKGNFMDFIDQYVPEHPEVSYGDVVNAFQNSHGPKTCNVTFKYRVKENETAECNRRDRMVSITYYSLTELTLKLLQDYAQKEFNFPATTHDEIVIKYNKSILSNDVTLRSIFKTKENIELIVTLDKKCFSSYKNLREVLQKHGIDNDEVRSIPVFFPNCENEENYKEVFEDCVKEIKARLSAIGNVGDQNEAQRSHFITSILVSAVNSVPNTILRSQFEIIGDLSIGRVDYAIKKIYPQLVGGGFEEIICVTEAKQIDIKVGVAQNLMQLEGSLDSNKNKKRKLDELYPDQAYSEYVYGIVSTGVDWYFLKHTPDQIFCSQAFDIIPLVTTQLNNDEDLRKGIKTVLGKIIWMLKDRDRTNKRQRT